VPHRSSSRRRAGDMKTTSATLQAKLDQLAKLARVGNKVAFVAAFVPLDLTTAERNGYITTFY
jgi:hypothetical protein